MLSYEPMLVWNLLGPIAVWNAGAERLYGFASNEAVGRSSHALLQTKFPIELTDLVSRPFGTNAIGQGSCAISAKMVAKSS